MTIVQKTNTANTTASKGRTISYIVEHYTAGTTSKAGQAANVAAYFAKDSTGASADFIVDDATAVQYNPDPENRYCWAVGGNKYNNKGGSLYGVAKNANCISIEICSTNSQGKITDANDQYWSFTDAVIDQAVELTKYLMEKYGIDADHVIRHYDVNGKPCPGVQGWNADSGDESAWLAFKARLTGDSATSTGVGSATSTGTTTSATTSGTTSNKATTAATSTKVTLSVDGSIGPATVKRLQEYLGTTQDSFISGQKSANKKYWSSVDSSVCSWNGGTSQVVKALQKLVGATQDGYLGQTTAKKTQTFLIGKGYSCGSTGVDGSFGPNSAKALQKFLNEA